MRFWLNSDGKSAGGRRFFARVEEVMVDKDGKPVYVPTPAPEAIQEPAPEVTPEVVAEPVVVQEPVQDDSAVVGLLSEVVGKCDVIIDLLGNKAQAEPAPCEEVQEEVVAEPVAEVANEEAEEEVAATEYVDFGEQEPAVLFTEMNAAVEVPAEAEAPAEAKAPAPRSRSFAEKMRDASEVLQDRYDDLKNYALRFRKLKARISRKFDSINAGRFQFVKLGLAGKTLKLYLNMDINTTDPKFHCKDMSDKKTYVTVPTMLRIKSGRAVKYAKILIDQCAEQHGMLERRKPFVVDAMALIEEFLAAKEAPDTDENEVEEVAGGDAE